ncbi:MAG TPA: cation:proton antiporter [Solimonas sp.]|nr:cation:proton antiporter [Solimonas sp.]
MDSTSGLATAEQLLTALALILAAGAAGGALAGRIRVPDVAVFLLLGILLGPAVLGWVALPAGSAVNQFILMFGSCYILFDGGMTLRLAVLKQVWITIVAISTVGVAITAAVTGAAASVLLDMPLPVGLLLGAVIASTDPATLVPVFRQVKIRQRLQQTVISESAFNDAMGAILTFTLLGVVAGGAQVSLGAAALDLLREAGLGIGVGAVIGVLAAVLLAHPRMALPAPLAPVITLAAVAGAYACADALHASGFMAVFVLGVVVGNRDALGLVSAPGEADQLEHYVAAMSLVLRLLIFVLLGTQVDFALVGRYLLPGLAVVAVFMGLARPLTVLACAAPDRRARWSRAELLFMCWTRETGVIPAALAGMLLGMNAPGAETIAAVTFLAILATILIQAPSTAWLGRKLGLMQP